MSVRIALMVKKRTPQLSGTMFPRRFVITGNLVQCLSSTLPNTGHSVVTKKFAVGMRKENEMKKVNKYAVVINHNFDADTRVTMLDNYDKAKAEIEAQSKKKPTNVDTTANFTNWKKSDKWINGGDNWNTIPIGEDLTTGRKTKSG